eukprot:403338395
MSFVMDEVDCTDDINLSAFTMGSETQLILAGYVDPVSSSSCAVPSNSGSTNTNFITSLDIDGNFQWYQLVASSTYSIQSLISSSTHAFAAYASTSDVRILKLLLTTGAITSEKAVIHSSSSLSSISNLNLYRLGISSTSTTKTNYLNFKYTESSTVKNLIMRFDDNLGIVWTRILTTSGTQVQYHIADMCNMTDGTVIQLNMLQTANLYHWTLHQMNLATGVSQGETVMYSSENIGRPSVFQGAIKTTNNYIAGAFQVKQTTVHRLAIFSVKPSNLLLDLRYIRVLSEELYSPQIEVLTNGFIALTAYSNPNIQKFYVFGATMQTIFKEQRLERGSTSSIFNSQIMKMRKFADQNDMFLVYQVDQFFNPLYPQRIVIHRVSNQQSIVGDILGFECIQSKDYTEVIQLFVQNNFTTTSFITNSNDATPVFSLTTPSSASLTDTTLTALSSALTSLELKTDTKLQNKAIQTSTQEYLQKDQSSALISFDASIGRCQNTQYYTIDSVTLTDSTALSLPYSYNSTNKKLQIDFDEKLYPADQFVGSQSIYITGTNTAYDTGYEDVTVDAYMRVVIEPPTALIRDPLNSEVDIEDCNSELSAPIYPLFYGHNKMVEANFFDIDNSGNLMLAGQSKQIPFAPETLIGKGFLAYIDQLAKPYWIYYLDLLDPADGSTYQVETYSYTYHTKIYGLCTAYRHETQSQAGVLVKLNATSGILETIRFLPSDYTDVSTNYQPLFIKVLSNSELIIAKRYSESTYSSYTVIRLKYENGTSANGEYTPVWYKKYLSALTATDDEIDMMISDDLGYLYTFRHSGSSGEVISQIKLSNGLGKRTTSLTNHNSDGNTNQIVVSQWNLALLTLSTSTYSVSLWELDRDSLVKNSGVKLVFDSEMSPTGANVQYNSDTYRIIVSGTAMQYIQLSADLTTIEVQKIWEYQSDGTGYYNLINSAYDDTNLFFAVSGQFTSVSEISTLIFRLQDDFHSNTCILFRDIFDDESDYQVATIDKASITAITLTVTDLQASTTFSTDNYYVYTDFMSQANGVNLGTYSFEETQQHNWGLQLIPDFYDFRYPQQDSYQCGAYARVTENKGFGFIKINGENQTYTEDLKYIEITLGDTLQIQINEVASNCQGKEQDIKVFTSGSSDLSIDESFISYSEITKTLIIDTSTASSSYNRRQLMNLDGGLPEPRTYALILRYQDKYLPTLSFFDHQLTIRVLPQQDREQLPIDSAKCYQNVYPISFGGCADSNCDMFVNAAVYSYKTQYQHMIYIGGQVQQGNTWLESDSATGDEAFVMAINDVGMPEWYTNIDLSQDEDERIMGLALGNEDSIFAYFTTLHSDFKERIHALIKMNRTNGFIMSSQSINIYSISSGHFSIYKLNDFKIVPFTTSNSELSLSFSYQTQGGLMNVGNLRIKDTSTLTEKTMTLTMESIRSLAQVTDTMYLSGSQLFNQIDTTSKVYYESHLIQYGTDDAILYLAKINDKTLLKAQTFELTGEVSATASSQTAMTMDSSGNVYLAAMTDSNQYLLKHDSIADTYSYYSFSVSGVGLLSQIDITCLTSSIDQVQFLVLSFIDSTATSDGQYFITLTTSFAITSLIRYDQITATSVPSGILLLSYPTQDNFFYVRNSPAFAYSSTNSEIVIGKKSLSYTFDNKYDCQASATLASSGFTLSAAISTAPTQLVLDTDVFMSGFYTSVNFLENPYISSTQITDDQLYLLYPNPMKQHTDFYFSDDQSLTCAQGNGIQSPYNQEVTSIKLRLGSQLHQKEFDNEEDFTQCQGLDVGFQFKYENGLTTKTSDSEFITFNTVNQTLSIDLKTYSPAASSRILELDLYTDQDETKTSSQPIHIHIFPAKSQVAAPTKKQRIYDCENDKEYPKVLGDLTHNFIQYGADLDSMNGNILICGRSEADLYPNSHFYQSSQDTALNLMTDIYGKIYWTYSAAYLGGTSSSYYVSCQLDPNVKQVNVYSLIYIEDQSMHVYVEQDYKYGRIKQVRRIPGTYSSGIQSGLSISNDGNKLRFSVYGQRSDTLSTHGNEFSLFQSDDTIEYYQAWNAYSIITAPVTTVSHIHTLQFVYNDLFAVSLIQQDSDGRYVNLAKYDGNSGERLKQISFTASITGITKFGLVIDEEQDELWISYSSYSGSHSHIIKSFQLDMTLVDGVSISLSSSVQVFETDLAFDDSYLYEHFHLGDNKVYIIKFDRSTLNIVSSASFTDATMIIKSQSLFIRVFDNRDTIGDYIMTFFSTTGYLASGYTSAVINRFDEGIVNPNTCITYTTLSLSGSIESSAGITSDLIGINAKITTFTIPSYFKLQHQFQIYFENKFADQGDIFFRPASGSAYECTLPDLVFTADLQKQTIFLPQIGKETVVYFALPDICNKNSVIVKVTLEKYDKFPEFISTLTTEEGYQRISFWNLNDTHVGSYNFKIEMTLGDQQLIDYFYVYVQPRSGYELSEVVESQTCPTDSLPSTFMTFGGIKGNIYAHTDLSQDGESYIICGANKDVNNDYDSDYYQSFVQLLTIGHAVKWHLTISGGAKNNVAHSCHFGYSTDEANSIVSSTEDLIVTFINSQSTVDTTVNDTIYIMICDLNGKLEAGKMIKNHAGLTFEVQNSIVVKSTSASDNGDMIISGVVDGDILGFGELSFFIMRITRNFELVYYSTLDFGSKPSANSILFDISSTTLYHIFGYQVDSLTPVTYRWGIAGLNSDTGILNTNALVTLANSTFISRNNDKSLHQQALFKSTDNYLYTCFIYKLNSLYDEVALTRHDSVTLLPVNNLEFNRGQIQFEACSLQERSGDGALILALSTFEQTYLLSFDKSDSTISMVAMTDVALSFYHQRFNPFKHQFYNRDDEFTLFIRSINFDTKNEERLFQLKFFTDLETPQWQNMCSQSDIQLTTSTTFQLALKTEDDGLYNSQVSYWIQISVYDFKQVLKVDFDAENYVGNPGDFGQKLIQGETVVYRDSFLQCSRYSNPVAPDAMIASDSTIQSMEHYPFYVRHQPFQVKLNKFSQCSNDKLKLEIMNQDGSSTPEGLFGINQDTMILTINANTNLYFGTLKLRYQATVQGDTDFFSYINFSMHIEQNYPPWLILDDLEHEYYVSPSHLKQWVIQVDQDDEGDEPIFEVTIKDNSGLQLENQDWFRVVSTNLTHLIFETRDPPLSNINATDVYYVNLTVTDIFNQELGSQNFFEIELYIRSNQAPVLKTRSTTLNDSYPGIEFNFLLSSSDFYDREGDEIIFTCDLLNSLPSNTNDNTYP